MSAPFQYREHKAEKLHKALYELHWAIYKKAMTPLTEALKICNELELSAPGAREAAQAYIAELRGIRGMIEAAGSRAANFRTRTMAMLHFPYQALQVVI